jgi:dihydroorotase
VLGVASGRIEAGAPADVIVFDPRAPFRVTAESLRSQGKNTPFLGHELAGRVRATLVAGNVVYEAR